MSASVFHSLVDRPVRHQIVHLTALAALVTLAIHLQAAPTSAQEEGNLAQGRPVQASSEEAGKDNVASRAVDGKLDTRWCAADASAEQWWQVDLQQEQPIGTVRIHWESDAAYRYRIELSRDGQQWDVVVNAARNRRRRRIAAHRLEDQTARYVKITFLGASTGAWASFWEVEVYPEDAPDLPPEVADPRLASRPQLSDVEAPEMFDVRLYATPPEVNYPVCLTTSLSGDVFVGVDPQGSLGKRPNQGKVLRCRDTDGDGQADAINVFAEMDHPRGLFFDAGRLWVLHPPYLSLFVDEDGDGKADREETLITGISTDQVDRRGADHTTNGIRMAIDGWIYIAVGDFGLADAIGTDAGRISRRGGGVVRVRPDGTEMEVYCWGLRNILDVCIDPRMNAFSRDNTNDGGGWDIRLSHLLPTANYGYPSLFRNFTDETMPPLADYGGGSGCGGLYLQDARWPDPFADALYTCDWGRSEVYRHNLPATGATFAAHQELFVKIPRPTDIEIDASGRMYISSWKNGNFSYEGENIGFVAQLVPRGFEPEPVVDFQSLTTVQLLDRLRSPSAEQRLHAQRTLLRRDRDAQLPRLLLELADDGGATLETRIAALYTAKQLAGPAVHEQLLQLAARDELREHVLRVLTDRLGQLDDLPTEPFVAALHDPDPRVRAQAIVSLGRLGRQEAASAILPLTRRQESDSADASIDAWRIADPSRVIPHLAVQALVRLGAVDTCLAAIGGPDTTGALAALKALHRLDVVEGLTQRLDGADADLRQQILETLIRLYYREAAYAGDWWGTRPDSTGPYYDRAEWAGSPRIAVVLREQLAAADPDRADRLQQELRRHRVRLDGAAESDSASASDQLEDEPTVIVPKLDTQNPELIGNQDPAEVIQVALELQGDPEAGQQLFTQQSCVACHTTASGQTPKGPHLVDIGKRYTTAELLESILTPSAKIAQGFDTYSFITNQGKVFSGFSVSESAESVVLKQADGKTVDLPRSEIDEQIKLEQSVMPEGLVNNLTPAQLADLIAYLQSLRSVSE